MGSGSSNFRDAVALVTGGGSGIGRAVALRFAREGARVVVAGRRPDPLTETVEAIRAMGSSALAVPTDLARRSDVEALVAAAVAEFGHVDHVVNNAVMNYGGPYGELSTEQILHMIEVGFTAPLLLTRLALPHMRADKGGSVIMIGSTAFVGWPEVVTYSAIKAGLDGFAQGLRRELAAVGIHVGVVHPAGTDTPSMTPQARAAFEQLGFRIYPADAVADAVVSAIRGRRARVVVGRWERRHVRRSFVHPRLIDRTLSRMREGFQAAMHEHQTPS
jgi:uncharacterized oxidoreductase